MYELFSAVEPFLKVAQEALPQVPESTSFNMEGFNHLPAMEVENRLIVPTNTHLRDIVRTGTISFSGGGVGVGGEGSSGSGANQEITQDQIWNELEAKEAARAAQKEKKKVLARADRLEQDYNLFQDRAVALVLFEGIQVEDPKDIIRAAGVFLEEKTPQQVSYACRAIANPNSKIAKGFLAELEAFLGDYL